MCLVLFKIWQPNTITGLLGFEVHWPETCIAINVYPGHLKVIVTLYTWNCLLLKILRLFRSSCWDFFLESFYLAGRRQKGNVSDGVRGPRRAVLGPSKPRRAGLLITRSSAATRPPNTAPILTCIQTQIQIQIHKQSLFNKQCQGSTKQKTFISTWCEDI